MEAQPKASKYLAEFQPNARALIAASAGMGAGFLLNHYIASLFAPHIISEFGWSRSDFALTGMLGLLNLFLIPVVGRMTDLLGVRPVALVGVVVFPFTFVAYSFMSGSLAVFIVITLVQHLLAAATTTSIVYSRLVAERFVTARGLALALAATAPALAGVVGSPLIHHLIEAYGWRTGYLGVAAYVGIVGGLGIVLIPARPPNKRQREVAAPRQRTTQVYAAIARLPTFWVICGGMFLGNLIYPLLSSQMKLMLLEIGASSETASWLISLFAAGVMFGRFTCGLALDRFPAHLVTAIALALPAIGLFALGFGFTTPVVLAASVMLFGLTLGAESDLVAYLVMRFFRIEVYSTVLGLVVTAMAVSSALGSVILSTILEQTGTFRLYILLCGTTSTASGAMFLTLARRAVHPQSASPQAG